MGKAMQKYTGNDQISRLPTVGADGETGTQWHDALTHAPPAAVMPNAKPGC